MSLRQNVCQQMTRRPKHIAGCDLSVSGSWLSALSGQVRGVTAERALVGREFPTGPLD